GFRYGSLIGVTVPSCGKLLSGVLGDVGRRTRVARRVSTDMFSPSRRGRRPLVCCRNSFAREIAPFPPRRRRASSLPGSYQRAFPNDSSASGRRLAIAKGSSPFLHRTLRDARGTCPRGRAEPGGFRSRPASTVGRRAPSLSLARAACRGWSTIVGRRQAGG